MTCRRQLQRHHFGQFVQFVDEATTVINYVNSNETNKSQIRTTGLKAPFCNYFPQSYKSNTVLVYNSGNLVCRNKKSMDTW